MQSVARASQPVGPKDVGVLAAFILVSFAAGGIGTLAMSDFEPWYASISKPDWTPPGALIGAVWSVLYLVIGVAGWLVWREAGFERARRAFVLYGAQLVLNALWTPLFFGAHMLGVAFAEIVLLWFAILATGLAFHRVKPLAAWLLAPYLAWVTFAGFLNATIWAMNA